jgi:hypothetical protein
MSDRTSSDTSDNLCLIGQALILVIIYVGTFKSDAIVFIDNVIMSSASHEYLSIIFSIMVSPLILTTSFCVNKGKKLEITYNEKNIFNLEESFPLKASCVSPSYFH